MEKKAYLSFALLASSVMLAACNSSLPAVTALMQQVTQACQSGKEDDIKACFAKDHVTQNQIDEHVGSWDSYFDKSSGPQYAYTYSGIRYVSLADAAHDKDFLPDTIASASPVTTSGIRSAPNIKVIGFIEVSFKQGNGTPVGPIEMVGIASDGSAKLALVEPQK